MHKDDILHVCKACGAKCCKLGGTDFSGEEKAKVLAKGHKDHFLEIGEDHHEVKCRGGRCPYLDKDNSCLIHEERPLLCKRWPVFTSIEEGKRVDSFIECPLAKLLPEEEIAKLRVVAEKIPDHFIKVSIENSKVAQHKTVTKRFNEFKERAFEE